ncbi:uncharacterized protein G2W53_028034 [Senna tora]|uniref:B-block binding subunit of TFIIIC domain-containing protein n=1 Tax=Senna tora TaxID=362788 RepID=A0A834T3P2_9FABA|nr:uncharacterized protein G2W53_028034 [Senna tora]
MDSVVNAALEEICSQLQDGLTPAALWPRLQPVLSSSSLDLSPGVKQAIWANLLLIPALQFEVQKEPYSPVDPSIQSFEDAERLNLKIVSRKNLRDNFVGLYESNSLATNQMRVLELLANARFCNFAFLEDAYPPNLAHGITQSQLGKQLRIEGNNFHYVLRSLECQGLIVKKSALERKKETCADGELKNLPCVSTNLVYLHRYAKQLGSHQRFEITTEEQKLKSPEDANRNSRGEIDVLVKDYAPQIKAICDKLEKANGKVLIVSDIKKDLGYCGSRSRQRAWREICRRLKADNIVEQFDAKVNGKVLSSHFVPVIPPVDITSLFGRLDISSWNHLYYIAYEVEACLRLLDPITTGSENEDKSLNSLKNCQVVDQFVELPLEHQIFDMIDAAGSDGINLKEISERLGIDLKKNHTRLIHMCHRFGMKVQEEHCQKFKTIRVWTSRNFNPEPEVEYISKPDENKALEQHVPDRTAIIVSQNDPTSDGEPADPENLDHPGTDAELSCGSPGNMEFNYLEPPINCQEVVLDPRGTISNSKHDLVSAAAEGGAASSRTPLPDVSKLFPTGAYRSLSFTVNSTRRAKRILERLEVEKFILRPEMHRWLNSFEKDKCPKVDRKTIDRILKKLQEQELCKLITVSFPVVTNYSVQKQWMVVVHPSTSLSSELFDKIQDRARSFDIHIRSQGTSHRKDEESIPVMEDVQKSESPILPDERPGKAEAMRANGFVLAKMVRAKLLHCFLWDYLNSSASHNGASSSETWVNELNNPHSSSKLFSLEASIKSIPVELFLQVVGSTKKYEEMIEKCKMGLRLCDLPVEDYKSLMDTHATGRLSLVVDILRRLKDRTLPG